MKVIQETQKFNPIEVKVLVETQEEYDDLLEYIKNYGPKPVSFGNQPDEDGWISNEGNDNRWWPNGYGIICNQTVIEVLYRNGEKETLVALHSPCWKSTDFAGYDIIKFRILKD